MLTFAAPPLREKKRKEPSPSAPGGRFVSREHAYSFQPIEGINNSLKKETVDGANQGIASAFGSKAVIGVKRLPLYRANTTKLVTVGGSY